MWDKLDQTVAPDLAEVEKYVATHLWPEFISCMEDKYGCAPQASYSSCSMLRGWNFKYKKGSRALCTVYPMKGYFAVLVALGTKETEGAEQLMPTCTEYMQKLYEESKPLNGTRWVLPEIREKEVLDDLMNLIALRFPAKSKASKE